MTSKAIALTKQKEQRTHRKQTPMPKLQQQPPPSQRGKIKIKNKKHSKKWYFGQQQNAHHLERNREKKIKIKLEV